MPAFIPDLEVKQSSTPYFEDSSKLEIPGRGTHKSIEVLQREVTEFITKLGGYGAYFVSGVLDASPKRYGYQIHFRFANSTGRIDCAALPMKNETAVKKKDALKQALYLLRNKLEAQYFASMYEPGSVPLVPYLIGSNGKTVTEALVALEQLPMLHSGH